MKKEIYFGTLVYKWRTVNYVKGARKPSKTWNKGKLETVFTELELDKLNDSNSYISRLKQRHKSSKEIELEITEVLDPVYLCMSNDIY